MSQISTFIRWFGSALIRRKPIEIDELESSRLKRCLNTFDLTALGVGSTLGLGVYVLAGQVAVTAGPSVILSFVIAAIASVFAGLCYAEFAARVPKAGSAYVYSYTTVGEFIGFVIGWNLILEYVIGTASVARGFSAYVDTLVNSTIKTHMITWMPMEIPNLSPYFDIFAFAITMFVTVLVAFGVKESAQFTAVFTAINLYVVSFVTVCGFTKIQNFKNWNLPPHGTDKGGFFPFGFNGMINGAARCFYGFVGFDAIASTGEEASNPQRSMPISITLSLFLILLSYFGVAAASTLMWPYWDQSGDAPLADVFAKIGWPIGRYIIAVGAVTSLTTALLGSLFPLPRVLFAMSNDGLVPKFLRVVHSKTKTPLVATLFSGVFSGVMAAMFDLAQLTDMMSIGTLLAYTLVTLSVLILRYQEDHLQVGGTIETINSVNENRTCENIVENSSDTAELLTNSQCFVFRLCNVNNTYAPSPYSAFTANVLIAVICLLVVLFASILNFFQDQLFAGEIYAVVSVSITFAALAVATVTLQRQPQTKLKLPFKVPYLPYFPVISIFFNTYLMLKLTVMTWIRFGVWLAIGFVMYFGYGIYTSSGFLTENQKESRERQARERIAAKREKKVNEKEDPNVINEQS